MDPDGVIEVSSFILFVGFLSVGFLSVGLLFLGFLSGFSVRIFSVRGFSLTSCLHLQSNWEEVVTSFDDMGLKEDLLRGIYAYGFEKPSAIQQRAIMPCIKG